MKKKRKNSGGIPVWVWIASGAAACVLIGVVLWLVLSGGSKFSKVKEGMTEQEILADFPDLRAEHIKATLSFAAQRERRLAA